MIAGHAMVKLDRQIRLEFILASHSFHFIQRLPFNYSGVFRSISKLPTQILPMAGVKRMPASVAAYHAEGRQRRYLKGSSKNRGRFPKLHVGVHSRGPGFLHARDPFYLPDGGPIEGKAGGVFVGPAGPKGWLRIDVMNMEFLNRRPELTGVVYIVARKWGRT
jgi:hypothetical protein